ncbi:acyl-CoA N-acyltransferase [Dendryphion nanum]|uniref:Acyl-CoA N-acyltransferase n=1 Tax=Dendryphion nanum TaxID=256645 RepID=A0A9P9EHZ0_9PLEO|nr:acyl-CoA N-acyltransferase [Dendryphion nanum]
MTSQLPPALEAITSPLQSEPAHPDIMTTQLSSSSLDPNTPLPSPLFTSQRLLFRSMHPQDAISMQKACEPASITRYMTLAFAHPYTLEHANTWIKLNLTDKLPNYVICIKESPETVIGGIGLKPGSDVQAHTAEVGYWIAEEYWGRGIATEALEALVRYAFENDQYKRLGAGVFAGNDASIRVLEKVGFKKEGVLREHIEKHGETMDLVMLGLTKKDWLGAREEKTI